jgi:hypothetical protein
MPVQQLSKIIIAFLLFFAISNTFESAKKFMNAYHEISVVKQSFFEDIIYG